MGTRGIQFTIIGTMGTKVGNKDGYICNGTQLLETWPRTCLLPISIDIRDFFVTFFLIMKKKCILAFITRIVRI